MWPPGLKIKRPSQLEPRRAFRKNPELHSGFAGQPGLLQRGHDGLRIEVAGHIKRRGPPFSPWWPGRRERLWRFIHRFDTFAAAKMNPG